MESITNCSATEVNMKSQMPEDPLDDVVKVNGDVNGSYEEEMEVCEDDPGAKAKGVVSQAQSNGDFSESGRVPSHENGVENAENADAVLDSDIDNSKTGTSELSVESCRDLSVSRMETDDVESGNNASENSNHTYEESNGPSDEVSHLEENDVDMKGNDDDAVEEEKSEPQVENIEETGRSRDSVEKLPLEEASKKVEPPPRKEALEITLVSRSSLVEKPKDSTPVDEEADNSCEALNMSLRKDPEENDDCESVKEDEENDPLKTPEKSQDGDDSIIEISPDKSAKKKKSQALAVTPRRSSRNLNKTKSYADKDVYIEELDKKSDDEVEEVIPTDPLADDTRKSPKKNTIVVNDTKRLVEIAAGSKQQRSGKKEPTLVIIDTNSILSGKGAIAVSQATLPQMTITPTPPRNAFSINPTSSMVPVLPSGIYPQKHLKVTPISAPATPIPPPQPKPIILPSLTDDMYVVEAPSFIVPYVYEKPPVTSLKEYVTDMEKTIKEQRAREEKERQKRKKEVAEKEGETSNVEEEKPKEDSEENKTVSVEEGDKEVSSEKAKTDEAPVEKDESSSKPEPEKAKEDKPEKEATEKSDKSDTETDEEVKESDEDKKRESDVEVVSDRIKKKSDSYFDNPLGKFFMQIGVNLVQEFVQTDLLRNQKRKRDRDGKNCPPEVHMAITSLLRTLECSKENNEPFKLELKKCSLCSFKTESELVMAHHLETPHMRNYVYRCNFCTMEVRSPHDILFHMEAVHNVRGRLERAPAFHQCPNCPFEDNQKGKLSRHLLSCSKKYKPERNQEPPLDWEPPAKIPKVRGARPNLGMTGAIYPTLTPRGVTHPMARLAAPPPSTHHNMISHRGRGRPPTLLNRYIGEVRTTGGMSGGKVLTSIRPGTMFRASSSNAQPQVLLPTPYQITNNQMFQSKMAPTAGVTAKLLQQPSISITPLPRQSVNPSNMGAVAAASSGGTQQAQFAKPGRPPGGKATFVICEICDGYIKDLEQLRNHMQWIHKVKIHPKMIYNRPPLNCQKCQFRFFTDQGLERHLLGSHGLVTSSMQEAANKGKDGGRCPVCGRVYQWKLLNHVARDHNMALKPAHLSYKCTVCTATFGMYKQFENHVYSAHSVVAKRVMPDKKPSAPQPSTSTSSSSESLLKPLKINDEITIIPQPARAKTKPLPQSQKTNNKV